MLQHDVALNAQYEIIKLHNVAKSCRRAQLPRANTIQTVVVLLAAVRNQGRALEFRQSLLAAVGRYSFMAMKIAPDLWTDPAFTFAVLQCNSLAIEIAFESVRGHMTSVSAAVGQNGCVLKLAKSRV